MTRQSRRHGGRRFDGNLLADLRLAAFRTQTEVAREVGVTVRQYQRWEGNESQPQAPHVRALAEVFGHEPAGFYRPADDPDGEGVAA
jgi:transcriptional regulator with XRE-family HTH domain